MRNFLLLCAAAASLTACSLERLTGTKPKAACMTRSYNDTIYVRYDSLPAAIHVRLGGCKP